VEVEEKWQTYTALFPALRALGGRRSGVRVRDGSRMSRRRRVRVRVRRSGGRVSSISSHVVGHLDPNF
jgi:hypothetical protein